MKKKGFTLLEMIIALGFASFLILSITRILRHAYFLLSSSNVRTEVDRRADDIFRIIEMDFSAATAMPLEEKIKEKTSTQKEESADKKEGEIKEENKESDKKENVQEKKEEKEKEDKGPSKLFLSSIQESDIKRKGKKKLQLFGTVNFITTNNLIEPGKVEIKPLRVLYSLVLDKAKSKDGKASYKLIRKETNNLENSKFSQDSAIFDKKNVITSEYLIAENIKALYIEYFLKKKEKTPEKKEEIKTISSFTWGEVKETKDILPMYATLRLELWDQNKAKEYTFDDRIIFWSYKTHKEEKKKEEKKTSQNKDTEAKEEKEKEKKEPETTQEKAK